MKRFVCAALALLICLAALCSCGKYDKIPSTDEELREIGKLRDYSIFYDELRCSVMNAKTLMAQSYGIDWNKPEDAEKYREELERRVYSGLKYNYAVQILFAENGYTIENDYIQAAVDQRIAELIDECGSRAAYKAYLRENFMTDRVLRFNIAISYAVNELIYSLCDQGAFDAYGVDFDIESLTSANPALYYPDDYQKAIAFLLSEKMLLRSEHIYIPEKLTNSEKTATDLFTRAEGGEDLTDLAKDLTSSGIVREELTQVEGERSHEYYKAAASLEHGDLTLLHTEAGWYIIRRLEIDAKYILTYYFDLIYTYLSIKTNEHLTSYEEKLEIEFTEFGKELDLVNIK